MRGCDVCGRRPRWIFCSRYDENPAVFCGFHAKGYLPRALVEVPEAWLKPALEYAVVYRRRAVARPTGEV